LTLDVAVANAVRNVGLSFEDAIAAVTEVPARAIGRGHDLGRLAAGCAADVVLMSDEFEVQSVWANGVRLASSS
jgi:N-acetylglucosamine-6-phosphate deacetylase